MKYYILSDDEVDETFEPVRTVQGILRMPRKRPHVNRDGTIDHMFGDWEVPDYPKWSSVPGFPGFLYDMRGIPPGVAIPLTAEERREYLGSKGTARAEAAKAPALVFLEGSPCIRIGGRVVRLSKRGHRLLRSTVERKALPHETAITLLEAEPCESGNPSPRVEFDGLRDYRRAILAKVREEAGEESAKLLDAAFRSENRVFVYDEAVLPAKTE